MSPKVNGHHHTVAVPASHTDRLHDAARRSMTDSARICHLADRLNEELDDLTPVNGVPVGEFDQEDSLVVATVEFLAANAK